MLKFNFSEQKIRNFEKAFGVVGFGIACWMIYRLGAARIALNLHLVNWGFFIIAFSKGFGFIFQSLAWKLILGKEGRKISFKKIFCTVLAGESLNYITLTKMGGEPIKIYGIKDPLTLAQAASSVIVLKFCTLLGFWLTLTIGFISILFNVDMSPEVKLKIAIGFTITTVFLLFISIMQKIGISGPTAWLFKKIQTQRAWLSETVARLTRLDTHILETYQKNPIQILLAAAICMFIWIEEFFFIWLVFRFLNIHENWLLPSLIGTLSLLLNSLFFFVPWRAGTQEGTMVLSFSLLNLSEPLGLSVAILRRMRELLWVFIGLVVYSLDSINLNLFISKKD